RRGMGLNPHQRLLDAVTVAWLAHIRVDDVARVAAWPAIVRARTQRVDGVAQQIAPHIRHPYLLADRVDRHAHSITQSVRKAMAARAIRIVDPDGGAMRVRL